MLDEGFGELKFCIEGDLREVGVLFEGGGGDEIELMNADAGNGIEEFGKVATHDDVAIEEEAKEGGNLGFFKLPGRSGAGRIKEDGGEKEGREFKRVGHVLCKMSGLK